MKRLFLALLLALPLLAGDSLVLTTSDAFQYDPPNNATWQNLTQARRIEVGLDVTSWNCGIDSFSDVVEFGTRLQLGCGGSDVTGEADKLCARSGEAYNSRQACVDVVNGNGNMIVVRAQLDGEQSAIQRAAGEGRLYIEAWDVDASNYQYDDQADPEVDFATTEDASGVQVIGGAQTTVKVLWVKLYSTVIEPGVSAPLPDPHGVGDMGDWEFDGNTLADASGAGMTLVNTAGATNYETTPDIDPAPYLSNAVSYNWMDAPTVRAGASVSLTGVCSSYADVGGCTCVWSDQSAGTGPDSILFTGSTTSCSTTAVFPTAGPYTLRLAATDNTTPTARTGTRDFEIGAVAQDSTSHVVYPSDGIALIVGPQLAFGNSQWPWMEDRRQAIGNWMGERIPDPSTMFNEDTGDNNTVAWGKPGAGTVSVSNGDATITGFGTDFQNDYCSGGTSNTSRHGIQIIDDAGLRWTMPIASCTDATHIEATFTWNRAGDSEMAYLKDVGFGDYFGSSENQNFYDNGFAYGAMYYATGLSKWLTRFNTLEANWWDYPRINKGQCAVSPNNSQCDQWRAISITGLLLWAEVNGTQAVVHDGLEELNDFGFTLWGDDPVPGTDIRPRGYALAFNALTHGLDADAGRKAVYVSQLDDALADLFSPNQQHPDGAFEHHASGHTTGAGVVTVTNGSPVVTCDTTCSFDAGTHDGKWWIAYATDTDRWSVSGGRRKEYQISSVDSATQITLTENYEGSAASGLSWRFADLNIRIMQPFIQAMPMMAMTWLHETGYYDGRQQAINALNYNRTRGYRSHAGGYYVIMDDAGCLATITAGVTNNTFNCQFKNDAEVTDFSGARYLMQEPMRASAYTAKYARDLDDVNKTALATHVDLMLGHAFGKWGGPQSDYDKSTCSTCYAAELEDPATTLHDTAPKNKNWGFGFGFGGAYVWDALRTNEPAAEDLVSYSVPLDIGSVGSATKASVTLYEPKGTVNRVVNDQTGSTAAVTGDARQGPHLVKIEYKDSMDSVLQTDFEMVAAPAGAAVVIDGWFSISGAVSF